MGLVNALLPVKPSADGEESEFERAETRNQ
jgi:hypothetical protein